jgi:hypothetical protein
MKRIIAIIAALALSVSLSSCGSNEQVESVNQVDLIKSACQLAVNNDFQNLINAFAEIAAIDSGYLLAAQGASYWARYKSRFGENPGIIEDDLKAFYALCGF